jgi:hypothetical protein
MNYCAPDFGGRDQFARAVTPHGYSGHRLPAMMFMRRLVPDCFCGAPKMAAPNTKGE